MLYALAVSAPAPYRETRPVLAAFEARLTIAENGGKGAAEARDE